MAREFDIVIFGASGFTGSLVAEYVAKEYDNSIKWAVAGRNKGKIEVCNPPFSHTYPMRWSENGANGATLNRRLL